MKSKKFTVLAAFVLVVFAFFMLYDSHPSTWKSANMTPPTPRLQAVLKTLKPHCFGRFLIDLPEGTTVAWGKALSLEIAPDRANEIDATVKAEEDRLKSEPRYPLTEHLNLYFETRNGPLPGMKHVIGQEDFDSNNFIRARTYFPLGGSLVAIETRTLSEDLDAALGRRADLARRLRPRADENEIPTDAGSCVSSGFVADRPDAAKEPVKEFLQVGFRLKDPADVHLSISIESANDERSKPPLNKRLKDSERGALLSGNLNLYGALTTFRRAARELPAWKDGFEFLTRTPDDGNTKSTHDFWMIVPGQIDSLLRPYVDIRMSSGVSKNTSGRSDPLWTDEEVIALWDALTSTIRVRPVTTKATEAAPDAPLGTLAATGRPCPRTGLWRCADEGLKVQGGREQRFRAGETMPSAVLLGEPSLLQRLRGETPTHASPTVWKLVSVDAAAGDTDTRQ